MLVKLLRRSLKMLDKNERKIARYVQNGGMNCMVCDSADLAVGNYDPIGSVVYLEIRCERCGSSWKDVHDLVYAVDLNIPTWLDGEI